MQLLRVMRMFVLLFTTVLLVTGLLGQASTVAPSSLEKPGAAWWRDAVIYEIYVRSFQDTNGDGVGDIRGIISRLDYLKNLGVDAIWLTPIFPSPQMDLGYDVSDYCAVDPMFGTMAEMDELIAKAKQHHIRVLLDLVLNHTSDQHPWFQASRLPQDAKRDWYVWREGRSGSPPSPPNNWKSRTDDPAWDHDTKSGQYFYHYFAKQQPDLNWRNPEVKKAMFNVVDFWLKKGVAGFRLDAVNMLFEDPRFRDEPKLLGTNEYGEPAQSQQYQRGLPEVHEVMRDLRADLDRFSQNPVLVGEVYTGSTQEVLSWYGQKQDEVQLPMNTTVGFLNRRDAGAFRKRLVAATDLPDGDTPLLVFDNHDQRRSIDRYGDKIHDIPIAKVIATILLASRGSALMYQGQEIGVRTFPPTRKEDLRDPRAIAGWPREKGRDGERTPMQWNDKLHAGFTSGSPWIGMPTIKRVETVEGQRERPDSLLTWYQQLLSFRRRSLAKYGEQRLLDTDAQNVLAWVRNVPQRSSRRRMLVLCNLSDKTVSLDLGSQLPGAEALRVRLNSVASQASPRTPSLNNVALEPFQVLIVEVR